MFFFDWNLLTALTMSAALRPAPATMMVCGAPFFSGAVPSFSGFSANFSRKSESLSKDLGSVQDVVSLIEFAIKRDIPLR